MSGIMRLPVARQRLGGSPLTISTGYPWIDGDILYAADLNAAFVPAVGVTDASDAAVGHVGEYQAIQVPAQTLTTGVVRALTSVMLTAGDWDVEGMASFNSTGGAAPTVLQSYVSGSPTGPDGLTLGYSDISGTGFGQFYTLTTGARRFSLVATAPIYLDVFAAFSAGTCTAAGGIRARRMR